MPLSESTAEFDLFISCASKDREEVARPLHDALISGGIRVWLDTIQMQIGDSKRRETEYGIKQSRYGLLILSPAYFEEEEAQIQLDGLTARARAKKMGLLPVRHGISEQEVMDKCPTLADIVTADMNQGIDVVARNIKAVVGSSLSVPASTDGVGGVGAGDGWGAVIALSGLLKDDTNSLNDRIKEALHFASEGDPTKASKVFLEISKERVEQGKARNREAAEALGHAGALVFLHDTEAALKAYGEAAHLDPENGNWWTLLGILHLRMGLWGQSVADHKKVLAIAASENNKVLEANANTNIGNVYWSKHDYTNAEAFHRKTLEIGKALDRNDLIASASGNLGLAIREQSQDDLERLNEALDLHQTSLRLYRKINHEKGVADQLGNIGIICREIGRIDKAEKYLNESLKINERLGDREGMATQYGELGLVYEDKGDLVRAESYLLRALETDRQIQRPEGMARHYGHLGLVAMKSERFSTALRYLQNALQIEEKLGLDCRVAQRLQAIADCHLNMGDIPAVEVTMTRYIAIAESLTNIPGMISSHGFLGELSNHQGNVTQSRVHWQEARRLSLLIGDEETAAEYQRRIDQ